MAPKIKNFLRKAARRSFRIGLIGVLALVLLEILYRYQIVDTYRRELNFLNPDREKTEEKAGKTRVLVMGDSFSAAPDNWVDHLRYKRPDLDILNSAVPGTGVRQANFMSSRRFSEQRPEVFIYQIYVGNDLFDLRYPTNRKEAGVFRNLYWAAANRLRSLSWLNYALGQFRAAPPPSGTHDGKTLEAPFDPEKFSPRERLYLRVEPDLIRNSVGLLGDRKADFESYLAYLDDLLEHCPQGTCRAILLVIPHCAQVHPRYASNMQILGAEVSPDIGEENYPFLNALQGHFEGKGQVQVLSALPALKKLEEEGNAAYFNNDIHLSPSGQEVLGALVGNALISLPK